MPNYSFVVDAAYDPMTYAEISAPVRESAAYHQALQDEYDKQRITNAAYAALLAGDGSEDARARYDEYMNALNSATDSLMKTGAWGQRNTLSNLRGIYSDKFVPVIYALQVQQKEIEKQDAQKQANQLIEFSRDARKGGVDYYLNNPTGGYETANPVTMAAEAGTVASMYAKRFGNDPKLYRKFLVDEAGYSEADADAEIGRLQESGYFGYRQTKGWSPDEVANWSNDPIMRNIVMTVMKSHGVDVTTDSNGKIVAGPNSKWSNDAVARMVPHVATGLVQGVGDETEQLTQDAFGLQAMKAAASGSGSGAGGFDFNDYYIDFDTLDDTLTDDAMIERITSEANEYLGLRNGRGRNASFNFDKNKVRYTWEAPSSQSQYFTSDGRAKGRRQYQSSEHVNDKDGKGFAKYRKFMEKYGFTYDSGKDRFTKDGKVATYTMVRDAVNQDIIDKGTGSYYHITNTGLKYDDLNPASLGLRAYEVTGLSNNKLKTSDRPKTLSSLSETAGIKDATINVSNYKGKDGLIIKIPTGDDKHPYQIYWVKAADINPISAIGQSYAAYQRAIDLRNEYKKKRGLTDSQMAYSTDEEVRAINGAVDLARKRMLLAMGQTNTVKASTINNDNNE